MNAIKVPAIRKVTHKDRKHFMDRDHGPYKFGTLCEENTRYTRSQSSSYGSREPYTSSRWRTKRELLNSAERNDKE